MNVWTSTHNYWYRQDQMKRDISKSKRLKSGKRSQQNIDVIAYDERERQKKSENETRKCSDMTAIRHLEWTSTMFFVSKENCLFILDRFRHERLSWSRWGCQWRERSVKEEEKNKNFNFSSHFPSSHHDSDDSFNSMMILATPILIECSNQPRKGHNWVIYFYGFSSSSCPLHPLQNLTRITSNVDKYFLRDSMSRYLSLVFTVCLPSQASFVIEP